MSVTIQNSAANPVPVTLTNHLSSMDVNVTNTSLDVDVTNTSFDVNVTNSTAMPVSVSNFPNPMSVTYTNAPGTTLPGYACKNMLVRLKPSLTALTPIVSTFTAHTGLNVHLWHYKLSMTVITPGNNVVFASATPFTGNSPDMIASAYIAGADNFVCDLHIQQDTLGTCFPTVSVLVVDGQSTATQSIEGYYQNTVDGAYSVRIDLYSSTTTSDVVVALTLDIEYTA